jgi:N-acetylglucosaminyldiphosphoundecaprenol N-acetyl-beta-D-mannosaminyltransferase
MQTHKKKEILGIGISAVNMETATLQIMDWIRYQAREMVSVAAVHSIVDAQREAQSKLAMQNSGICVPDGMPLVWMLKLSGIKNVSRVFGPDLMLSVCDRMSAKNMSAYYYGGAQGVAEELALKMEETYSGIRTAGTYSPPYRELTELEENQIVEKINSTGADIIWVGLGSPKQEKWMYKFRNQLTAPVLIGVGAAFDYNTGRIQRAPSWIQNSGLEWLFRLLQEPGRLWKRYMRNNPLFLFYIFCEKFGLKKF